MAFCEARGGKIKMILSPVGIDPEQLQLHSW
jgi:hypothetical protein